MTGALTITLLGGFRLERDGVPVVLAGRQPRRLFTLMALEAGVEVPVETLIDRMWGESLPANPRATLHTYVGRIRRAFGDHMVATRGSGYLLDVPREAVDVLRFVDLTEPVAEPVAVRRVRLQEALSLWRGDLAPSSPSSPSDWITNVHRPWLIERWLSAVEQLATLDLAEGFAERTVDALGQVVAAYPMRESAWVLFLTALERAGRPAEALEAYERVRQLLVDQLGSDPGPELQEVHQRLLHGCVEIGPGDPGDPGDPDDPDDVADQAVGRQGVPHQLPADVPVLAGRELELAMLDAAIDDNETGPASVIAVHGVGAVGKTALAVHWAHRVAEQFPDGQIYVNLWGFGPNEPMPAREAIGALLVGLGVAGDMPSSTPAAAARLRSMLAGRRALLVLDNARDAAQVRPLIPGGTSVALVTSRSQMRGLATLEGARRIALDALGEEAAVELLRRRLPDRGGDEVALADLAALCGRLPLALAVAAERCSRQPDVPLSELVTYLRGESSRLAALETYDDPLTDLRAVFSWSYAALDPDAQELFRTLGKVGAPDVGAPACAALMSRPLREVRRTLDRLVDASLLREHKPGRYQMHDLLTEYATELFDAQDSGAEFSRRSLHLFDWAIASVTNAMTTVLRRPPRGFVWKVPEHVNPPLEFAGDEEAWAWLDSSWPTFWVLMLRAYERLGGPWAVASTYLTGLLFSFLARRPATEALALQVEARRVAAANGMEAEGAYLDNHMGVSHARLGQSAEAEACFKRALGTMQELGLEESILAVRGNLGRHYALTGRDEEALAILVEVRDAPRERSAGRIKVLDDLAGLYERMGRYDEALTASQQAVDLEDGSTTAVNLVRRQLTIGRIHAGRGDLDTAADALAAAQAMLDQMPGAYLERALVLTSIGKVAISRGDRARGVGHLRDALAVVEEHGELDRGELTREQLLELIARTEGRYESVTSS